MPAKNPRSQKPAQRVGQPSARSPLLRRADQAVVAVAVAAALVLMGAWWVVQGGLSGGVIDIEKAPPREVWFAVDINAAEWPELAQLPDVGETLARRIVATRQSEGPFKAPEDLLRVEGIGPKTLEGLRPYLLPIPADEALVSDEQRGPAAMP